MADTFLLEIATPERLLLREQVSEAQIPAADGYLGILPEHAALVSELGTGELSFAAAGRRYSMVVSGGWVEVLENHVRVLATMAEKSDEIDTRRAHEALLRAQDRLAHPPINLDVGRALNAVKRAQARLSVASHK